jgi:UDP-glucose 4-epimerase
LSSGAGRILVTGGAGFIGSWLCQALLDTHEVVVFDNLRRDALRYSPVAQHPWLRVIQGDVLDAEAVQAAMAGCDTVFHLAAIAGVSSYARIPVRTFEVNLLGTRHVLEAARRLGVRRVVNLSTSEVYGAHAFRVDEESPTSLGPVSQPRWIYAVSKLAGEHLALAYSREHGVPVVSVRPFNVYGPRQVGEGAIQTFALRALRGEPLEVRGDGSQVRAWCYVSDFVDGLLRAGREPEAVGKTFNLGNPSSTITVLGLAELVRRVSGAEVPIVFREQASAEVELRIPNVERACRLLGWSPRVGLEEGVSRAVAWYRQVLADAPALLNERA